MIFRLSKRLWIFQIGLNSTSEFQSKIFVGLFFRFCHLPIHWWGYNYYIIGINEYHDSVLPSNYLFGIV